MACCQVVGPSSVVYAFLILKNKLQVNIGHLIGVTLNHQQNLRS